MSRGLSLPLGQFCLGCGIRHVGNLPGSETDAWMQMQGNMQENSRLSEVNITIVVV